MKEKILKEIIEAINGISLSQEEKEYLDTYIQETIEKYSFFIDMHESVIRNDKELEKLKKDILKILIGESNV